MVYERTLAAGLRSTEYELCLLAGCYTAVTEEGSDEGSEVGWELRGCGSACRSVPAGRRSRATLSPVERRLARRTALACTGAQHGLRLLDCGAAISAYHGRHERVGVADG